MNSIKFEDYETALFQAYIQGDVNIIVSDSSFHTMGTMFKKLYFNVSEAIEYYLADLHRIYSGNLLSGSIHEALGEYIALFDGISEKVAEIGEVHNNYCQHFIRSVDDLDREMYEPGCDPRDYTTDQMKRFCSRIEDVPGGFFSGLENWINNGFEWLRNSIFNITGSKLGADKSLFEIRASILDNLDYEKKDIKLIHESIIEEDTAFGQRFANLYHEYTAILAVIQQANEIVCNVDRFTKTEIAGIRANLDNIHISKPIEEEHLLTVDAADDFCTNPENRDFFDEHGDVLQTSREDMGLTEAFIVATVTSTSQASAEFLKSWDLPEGVTTDQAYEYLLIKQELADTVGKMADNEVDVNAFLEGFPDIQQWYKEKKASDDQFCKLLKFFGKDHLKMLEADEDLLKTLATAWWNYEKNQEILTAMLASMDSNSLTAIAAQDLLQEYDNYGFAVIRDGLSDIFNDYGVGTLKKSILKLMGDAGKKLSMVEFALKKASEMTGITQIGNDIAKFDCLQRQNEYIDQLYKQHFDIVASGNYTEQDVINLNNSFTLLKSHYAKQFDCLEHISGKRGDHDMKRYYGYLEKQMKDANITDLSSTPFLTFDEYMATIK